MFSTFYWQKSHIFENENPTMPDYDTPTLHSYTTEGVLSDLFNFDQSLFWSALVHVTVDETSSTQSKTGSVDMIELNYTFL